MGIPPLPSYKGGYDPRPGHDKEQFHLLKFARDQRYKLYSDGRLFDIEADVLEERPLASSALPTVRRKLQAVIDRMAREG